MPKFTVEQVEPVEFDLRSVGIDAHGVIPEPNEGQIRTFMRGLADYLGEDLDNIEIPETEDGEASDREGIKRFLTMADNRPRANKAVAEFCSHAITEEQVAQLSFRVFMQFIFFLRDALMDPEAGSGDSTPPTKGETSETTGSSVENSDSPSPTSRPSETPSTSSYAAG